MANEPIDRDRPFWMVRVLSVFVALASTVACIEDNVSLSETTQLVGEMSCAGQCGGAAPGGCSCEPDCSWKGTCCLDVAAACGPAADDGFDYANILAPVTSASPGAGWRNFLAPTLPPNRSQGETAAGLIGVEFADIDDGSEFAECAVHNDGVAWYVQANTSGDDESARCTGSGLRVPWLPLWLHDGRLKSEDYYHASTNGAGVPTAVCLPGTPADSIPILRTVWMNDSDDGSETTRCVVRVNPQLCGGTRWVLEAEGPGDSDAECTARLLFLPRAVSGNAHAGADQDNNGYPSFPRYKVNKHRAREERVLADDSTHVCFLHEVALRELDDGYERASCKIVAKNGKWTLVAEVTGWDQDTDANAWCGASCAEIPDRGIFPNWQWPTTWPAKPTTSVVSGLAGARAVLYQSGAYDRPLVVLEGFDPTNDVAPRTHMVRNALFMRALEARGFDIWILDFEDAGQNLVDSAHEAALIVHTAYEHGGWNTAHPGKEIPVLGASMGGVVGRIALASWESGAYAGSGLTGVPPVSTFVSVSAPHEGARMPLAVQSVIQDLGDYHDLGAAYRALNSPAAVNLLQQRVSIACDRKVTRWCDAPLGLSGLFGLHGDYTVKEGNIFIRGNQISGDASGSCPLDDQGCVMYDADDPDGSSGCDAWAVPQAQLQLQLAHLGLRGNGFPGSVRGVGVATSSWLPQGTDNMSESCEIDQTPFTTDTVFGHLFYAHAGSAFPFSFCKQTTNLWFYLTSPELTAGDVLPPRDLDPHVPSDKVTLFIKQKFPSMFVPTASALACPGAAGELACFTMNGNQHRFDRIHSRQAVGSDGLNAGHLDLDDAQASWVLAYLWDGGSTADGDLHFSAANPFRQPFMPGDCNDNDPAVGASAMAACTTTCGSIGTRVCTNGEWQNTCYPPAEKCCDRIDNDCDGATDEGCSCSGTKWVPTSP